MLGHESVKHRFLKMDEARKKVVELSERYKFKIDPDALISDITVGMQQRVGNLKKCSTAIMMSSSLTNPPLC